MGSSRRDGSRGPPLQRDFSVSPRTRRRHTPRRLAELVALEEAMGKRLRETLDDHAAHAALISRIGSDLSRHEFEDEKPLYTHSAFAVREGRGWCVHHLLNTREGPTGHLYRQTLADFFRDDPWKYQSAVLVPSETLQRGIAAVLRSPIGQRLHTRRYSRVAYPFSTRYQNSSQWMIEVIGAAQGGAGDRRDVQAYLGSRGLAPSVLRTTGILGQTLAGWFLPNTRFDDHPLPDRVRGRLSLIMHGSLARYIAHTDTVIAERVVHPQPAEDTAHVAGALAAA